MHMAFLVARMFRCSVVFFIYIYNLCIKMLMAIKMPHLRMVEDGDTIFFVNVQSDYVIYLNSM